MKMKVGFWLAAIGTVALSYSACSPFHGMDMVQKASSDNNLASTNEGDNNTSGNGNTLQPMPMPQTPTQQMPSPSPAIVGGKINCPNRPSGAVTVLDTSFNTTDGEGQLWEVYPGAGKIAQPSGALGSASASILSPGQGVGGQQTIWPKSGKEQPLNNLYLCMRWKLNKDFVGLRTNNKLVFIAAQDFPFGHAESNGVLSVPKRGEAYPPNSFQMVFGHNSGNLNNGHTCTGTTGEICYPNVKDTPIYTDTWYIVEAHVISSTCLTCRNGTVKWWINGELNGNFTNMNYGDGIVNEWQINHTWDNGSDKQCGAPTNPSNINGRDCTKEQAHYFDHVILAAIGAK